MGAKDSTTCAIYALQSTARDNAKLYNEAAKSVLQNFYKNDYLNSIGSPEKVINILKELLYFLNLDRLRLSLFVNKVPNQVDQINSSSYSPEPKVIVSCEEDSSQLIVQMWDNSNDTLIECNGIS